MPTKVNDLPPLERLQSLFLFDQHTGRIFWRTRSAETFKVDAKRPPEAIANYWNSRHAGKEAGGVRHDGYRGVNIDGKSMMLHRVAYKMATGKDPSGFIDHINGNRLDNRLENLRVVRARDNQRNLSRASNNKSGFTGVYWCKTYKKWRATIQVDKKNMHVGQSDSMSEAINMRKQANVKYGFHENHGQR